MKFLTVIFLFFFMFSTNICMSFESGDVFVGNITDSSATIIYTTDFEGEGYITYGINQNEKTISEGRGDVKNHQIILTDLLYDTQYWFYITTKGVSGTVLDNNSGDKYTFNTFQSPLTSKTVNAVSGSIVDFQDNNVGSGANIIITTLEEGEWLPVIGTTGTDGSFKIDFDSTNENIIRNKITGEALSMTGTTKMLYLVYSPLDGSFAKGEFMFSQALLNLGTIKVNTSITTNIQYKKGFNLISLSSIPTDFTNISGLIRNKSDIIAAYKYNVATQSYESYVRTAVTGDLSKDFLGTDFILALGEGYWIKATAAGQINFKGSRTKKFKVQNLKKGFNLIGLSYSPDIFGEKKTGYKLSTILSKFSGSAVYKFNEDEQSYYSAISITDGIFVPSDIELNADNGFFVKSASDKTVWHQNFSKLTDTANILDDDLIKSIDPDQSFVVIDKIGAPSITTGQTIVGTTSEGILLKVDSVIDADNKLTIFTSKATLEEAIEECDISFSQEIKLENIKSMSLKEGVGLVRYKSDEGFYLKIDNVIIYDKDGNANTTNDQLKLNGNVYVKPDFKFELKIFSFKLKRLKFESTITEKFDLSMVASLALSKEKKVSIGEIHLNPIIIPATPPIVITPKITMYVGANAEIEGAVSMGIIQDSTFTAGVLYKNERWTSYKNFTNDFNFIPPTLSATATGKIYVGPQVSFKLYGVAGPYIEAHGYARLVANPINNPWWMLYGGLGVGLGVKVEVFSHTLMDWGKSDIIGYEEIIAQAKTGLNNAPTITLIEPEGSEIWSDTQNIKWRAADSDEEDTILLTILYSLDSGMSWCTLKSELPNTGAYSWDTSLVSNGADYRIKIIASDGKVSADDTSESDFTINNSASNSVPLVSNITVSGAKGDIVISYMLIDADSDICSISVSYSTDGGLTFPYTTRTGGGSDGLTGLSSSEKGIYHNYKWDSELNFFTNETAIRIKITPYDGNDYGVPKETFTFAVDNNEVIATVPILTTTDVIDIAQTAATFGGNVTSDGGASVTMRGICWSTVQKPTYESCLGKSNVGSGIGIFTSSITGLTEGTTYYVRAYATNSAGTGYGEQVSFTTNSLVKTLTSIILSPTNKSLKTTNDGWSLNEVDVTAHYDDDSSSVIENGFTWAKISGPGTFNTNTLYYTIDGAGTTIIRCTYNGKTADYIITVSVSTFTIHPASSTTMDFRYIPSGRFTMGSPDTELGRNPKFEGQHTVTITKAFYMAKYEVTQDKWQSVMGSNPSIYTGDNHPVDYISWYDSIIFCNRISTASGLTEVYYTDSLFTRVYDATPPVKTDIKIYIKHDANGYRLPTEAEWEYACRARTGTALNSGRNLSSEGEDANMSEVGRYYYNGGYGHTAVGRYRPNAWGLYDMHGNVGEWCQDWCYRNLSTEYSSTIIRVIRGGTWAYHALMCRSAFRKLDRRPSKPGNDVGFRPVRTVQ